MKTWSYMISDNCLNAWHFQFLCHSLFTNSLIPIIAGMANTKVPFEVVLLLIPFCVRNFFEMITDMITYIGFLFKVFLFYWLLSGHLISFWCHRLIIVWIRLIPFPFMCEYVDSFFIYVWICPLFFHLGHRRTLPYWDGSQCFIAWFSVIKIMGSPLCDVNQTKKIIIFLCLLWEINIKVSLASHFSIPLVFDCNFWPMHKPKCNHAVIVRW